MWIWEGLKRGWWFSPTVGTKPQALIYPQPRPSSSLFGWEVTTKNFEQGSRFKTICETVLTLLKLNARIAYKLRLVMRFGLRLGPPFLSAGPLLGSLSVFSYPYTPKNLHINWCTFMYIGSEHSYSSESFGSNLLFYSIDFLSTLEHSRNFFEHILRAFKCLN